MPKNVTAVLLVLATIALIPVACIARARAINSPLPAIHVWPDMDNQTRFKPQQRNPLFADSRAMRPPVEGTVARGMLQEDDHYYRGLDGEGYAISMPMPVTAELLERGKQRYEIFCTPCHGVSGYGDGIVANRADALQQGTWVPPSSFHMPPASDREDGHLFNTITNGIRTMPGYGAQIEHGDRWAIVAYIRALQRSQSTDVADVPQQLRSTLR
jgi:cytochrome c5